MIEQQNSTQFDADQQEIRQLIWDNKIPVKIILDEDSIGNDRKPFPLYTLFQRVHHPIFYYQQIHEYFEKFAPVPRNQSDIWLEWDKKPICWNIPFGATFDLNYNKDKQAQEIKEKYNDNQKSNDNQKEEAGGEKKDTFIPFLPIALFVHYGPCRLSTEVIPIPNIQGKDLLEIAKENYKFNVKEALQIRNDSDQALMQFEVEKQNQLWSSFVEHDCKTFFPLLDELFHWKNQLNNKQIKLPARIYISNYVGRIQISYTILTGNEVLGDLLSKYFPKIIRSSESTFEIINPAYQGLKVLCNGIVCNLNIPLLYFYKYFYHFDGFTYLCIQI